MAPVKKPQPSTRSGRGKPDRKSSSSSSSGSKPRSKSSKDIKRPAPKQVKTKRPGSTGAGSSKDKPKTAKKRQYTDAQLNLPAINSIVPAIATAKTGKGTGKKRGKIFVDDTESMMTILAMVNAEKEGQIESKVLKARQMEEIREARRKEAEKRAESRKGKLEEVKEGLKRKRPSSNARGSKEDRPSTREEKAEDRRDGKVKKRKSVSFA